jgi:hypothetical protein
MDVVAAQFWADLPGLDQFQRAYERMDTSLDYEVTNSASLLRAMLDIDVRIDLIANRFPGNGMVEHMAIQMKTLHRHDMLEQFEDAVGTGCGRRAS